MAEAQTSAEIVVAVRRVSGHYRATDYLLGFIAMGLVVLYMLLAPQVFSLGQMALEGMAGFVVGALSSAYLPPYAACLRDRDLEANVERAARATFYELGISRTSGRNGILVLCRPSSAAARSCPTSVSTSRSRGQLPGRLPRDPRRRTRSIPRPSRWPWRSSAGPRQRDAAAGR